MFVMTIRLTTSGAARARSFVESPKLLSTHVVPIGGDSLCGIGADHVYLCTSTYQGSEKGARGETNERNQEAIAIHAGFGKNHDGPAKRQQQFNQFHGIGNVHTQQSTTTETQSEQRACDADGYSGL